MKVILEAQHAVGHAQPRGVGYYSIQLIRALLKRKRVDYELTFFDYKREMDNASRAQKYFGEFNVPIHECAELDYRVASRTESVFTEKSYNAYTGTDGDVYHFMCPVSIPTNLHGRMILTIHDVIWEAYPGVTQEHAEKLHKIASARFNSIKPFVIADSIATKGDILKYTSIPEKKISVVYPSYDEDNMYPEKSGPSNLVDGDYFFFIGAITRLKNITGIVKAFDRVAEKHSGVKLVIAGKEMWEKPYGLYDAVAASPYKERIIFTGYVDTAAKRRLYSNARCFVFPSFCEGFGIPVLEAMACGCPVITADNTSLPEVGGDAALYVNAHDTDKLAFEMERVLTDDTLHNDMIRKGLAQKNRFSWEKTAEQLEEIYRKVCEIE